MHFRQIGLDRKTFVEFTQLGSNQGDYTKIDPQKIELLTKCQQSSYWSSFAVVVVEEWTPEIDWIPILHERMLKELLASVMHYDSCHSSHLIWAELGSNGS